MNSFKLFLETEILKIWDLIEMWVNDGLLKVNWSLNKALQVAKKEGFADIYTRQLETFMSVKDGDWNKTKVWHLVNGIIIDKFGKSHVLGHGPSHRWRV